MKGFFKNFRKRLHFWYLWLVVLILGDEYLKEGYLLNPNDFFKPFTHENLLLITTLIYIIINVICYIKGDICDWDRS